MVRQISEIKRKEEEEELEVVEDLFLQVERLLPLPACTALLHVLFCTHLAFFVLLPACRAFVSSMHTCSAFFTCMQ